MKIKPIRTKTDYNAALKEIERLFDAQPGTADADRLEVLAALTDVYEEKHYAIPLPDPIEAILYYMESRRLSRRDLEPFIGSRARVSEVLNRKRPLTLAMIRRLHSGLGISAKVLIQPYSTLKGGDRFGLPQEAFRFHQRDQLLEGNEMRVKSIRIPGETDRAIEYVARSEGLEKNSSLRKLTRLGLEVYVAKSYGKGKLTLREAAGLLNLPLTETLDLLRDIGIKGNIRAEDVTKPQRCERVKKQRKRKRASKPK